ncbi:hypothetical protein V6N11_077466 [Hibiscus sabdariffa]|uniref:Uncharacterized protein n=1 Tax=Hibiscus sabdariffa TaxID=183260 RepID=A0ABR2TD68_9ROSI
MKSFQLESKQWFSSYTEEPELKSFIQYIDSLKNFEKSDIPKDASNDSDDGFDLDPLQLICRTSYIQKVILLVVRLVGRVRELVSSNTLNSIFSRIKQRLDEAIVLENGCLSHFEVLTIVAFALFAQENVDIAIIELILGGPFLPHIDCILRERASSMSSPIISASHGGIRTTVKVISMFKGRPS